MSTILPWLLAMQRSNFTSQREKGGEEVEAGKKIYKKQDRKVCTSSHTSTRTCGAHGNYAHPNGG